MKPLKKHIQENGALCSFCRPKKTTATWKADGFTDFRFGLACNEHKDQLEDIDTVNEHLSEADYQTWMKL